MNRAFVSVAALLALAGCDSGERPAAPGGPTVSVSDPLCRPTPRGRQMTGCYMTLSASNDDRLVSVSSPDANLVQIHESRIESNMMMMQELRDGLPLVAGQAAVLAPGGNHLMLLGVKEPLAVGDTVTLELTFDNAAPIEVTARVAQPPAAEAGTGADAMAH